MAKSFTKSSQLKKNVPEKEKKKPVWGKKERKPLTSSKAKQLNKKKPLKAQKKNAPKQYVPVTTLTSESIEKLRNITPSPKISLPPPGASSKQDTKPKKIISLTKPSQVQKIAKDNPKIMPRGKYYKKCDWVFEKHPRCQICDKNPSDQVHHAVYGHKGRDDRSIIGVCEPCHYQVHHGIIGITQSREELETLGYTTHKDWCGEVIIS